MAGRGAPPQRRSAPGGGVRCVARQAQRRKRESQPADFWLRGSTSLCAGSWRSRVPAAGPAMPAAACCLQPSHSYGCDSFEAPSPSAVPPPSGRGELRPASGADGTSGLALGCLLRRLLLGRPPYLRPVLQLPGLFCLAGVGSVTARVADRLQEQLHVVAAEAQEHGAGRSVLAEIAQPDSDDRNSSRVKNSTGKPKAKKNTKAKKNAPPAARSPLASTTSARRPPLRRGPSTERRHRLSPLPSARSGAPTRGTAPRAASATADLRWPGRLPDGGRCR